MTSYPMDEGRIATLDVIRGIAVMGIFSVNIVGMSAFRAEYWNPVAGGPASSLDIMVWFLNALFVTGKMRTLFSILFGASLLLVLQSARASGAGPAEVHFRRMAVLFLFGIAHFLMWTGDILTLYALVGALAFFWRDQSPRNLLRWAAIAIAIGTAHLIYLLGDMAMLDIAAHRPGATAEAIGKWREAVAWNEVTPDNRARAATAYGGSFVKHVTYVIRNSALNPLFQLLYNGPETLGLMLIGMAGFKSGFLCGDWTDRQYRRVALIGIGAGGLGTALLAAKVWQSGFQAEWVAGTPTVAGPFTTLPMALGYAALIILLTRRMGALARRIAAVGRCAFTNYLGTTIVGTAIFYGWGLGQFGLWSRAEAWLLVPTFWLLMLLWSKPWLERFRYGPFEWAWRSLSRGELQPMRRRRPELLAI